MTEEEARATIMTAQKEIERQHTNMARGVAGTGVLYTSPDGCLEKQSMPHQSPPTYPPPVESRDSAKNALLEIIRRKRRQLNELDALARAIPDNFPADADAGLWQLVNIVRRS